MTDAAILNTLRERLGGEAVLTAEDVLAKHRVDFSGENAHVPLAVVRPASTAELSAVLAVCSAELLGVFVQGGLTGLTGGATPRAREIAVSLERMAGVEEIDSASMTATVLAGTPLQRLQQAASEAGFMFPLDLGARGSCTIGGNISTNAGGNQVIRFGMMRNLVLGLEAVLADGTVVSSMNKMLKNNAGYDLKQLFIGTEGTLGIVTRAVLRLYPRQTSRVAALCAIADFDRAVALLQHAQSRLAGALSAFEAMWASYFEAVIELAASLRSPFDDRHAIYVLVETEGSDESRDRERLEGALAEAFEAGIIADAVVAQSVRERESFWAIRDAIGEITPALQPMIAFDVSMPIAEMPGFLDGVERQLASHPAFVRRLVFGHLGDNNLHLTVSARSPRALPGFAKIVYAQTGAHGGSISAEHGIGVLKREYLHLSRSEAEIELMRRLKTALDPDGILNPGRVIPE